MFVFGLLIGPAVGVFGGEILFTMGLLNRWLAGLITALVLVLIAFIGIGGLELRLGLIMGILVGLLLAVTPTGYSAVDRESGAPAE